MKTRIALESAEPEALLPPQKPDGSRIGVNYADAYLQALNVALEDGKKVSARRKGLKVILEIGDRKGEALLRRLEDGPDPRRILRRALEEAASSAGSSFTVEDGIIYLDV
jgi:hypothetical protein